MEGLIPFVYRAIMQYKNGKDGPLGTWFNDSPSTSYYIRLPTGDSGRFQVSEVSLFGSDYGFSRSTSAFSNINSSTNSSTHQIVKSTGAQSPLCRLTPRRMAI